MTSIWVAGLLSGSLLLAGCGGQADRGPAAPARSQRSTASFLEAPAVSEGPLARSVTAAVSQLVAAGARQELDRDALAVVAATRDARLGWLVSDLLRFTATAADEAALVSAFEQLTGVGVRADPAFDRSAWQSITNHLIAWDLPAPPGYRGYKAELFEAVEPGWKPFFDDGHSDVDWRLVSWGGVLIDDRGEGDPGPCERGCIPGLDDPALTPASAGDWYPDKRLVFGVVEGDEAVAFPKNIMEVHEMVNITIGGRRLGIPYCTLCGSAQAYYLDRQPARITTPVLRTSGLLSRSNKLMYDLNTRSAIDTFSGRALSGPLHDARVVLRQTTVVTSNWGEWKKAHPNTRILARDGGIGREYPDDPLRGRDDNGPIFPIGDVDPRLPVQAQVLGVITRSGRAIAFPVDQARAALADGRPVSVGDVRITADAGGLRARGAGGKELPTHQAFWFAWSQFHQDTSVWTPRA